jgi:alpha-beta hydrolase superfamily lysophospholipase
MYAGSDKLVSPRGSAAFAKAAPTRVVEVQAYPELYHEIFNELERAPVYARLEDWLGRWFP